MLFRPVIGYEVPDQSMPRARPKTGAPTTIVARLVPKQAIPQSCQGVLCDKLSVARSRPFGVAAESVAPFQRTIRDLIWS